ncbi:hypothetical protein ACNPQM_22585 [Streptomyces sp. NPDC056231]|uniref:hypothetical protein n=1 Tax=Streptomyces sp. NPDC056231 TaxID=3345755 RepID=UPI003AAB4E04
MSPAPTPGATSRATSSARLADVVLRTGAGWSRCGDGQFRDAIRREHATLGAQREQLAEQLARLQSPKQAADPADTAALLDALPHLDVDLALVPEEIQRRLHSAFGLEVRYSRPREELTLRVTIPGCLVDGLVSVTRELEPWNKKSDARTEVLASDHGTRGRRARRNRRVRSHFSSAPGGGLGAWGWVEPLGGGGQLAIQTVVQLNRQARSGGSTSRKSSAGQVTCEVESN